MCKYCLSPPLYPRPPLPSSAGCLPFLKLLAVQIVCTYDNISVICGLIVSTEADATHVGPQFVGLPLPAADGLLP